VRRFNARLSANRTAWVLAKDRRADRREDPWLVITCDGCGTVVNFDLRVKPRGPVSSLCVALGDVRCPPRIVALARRPSI
jgi:hypothetical protein